MHGFQVVPAELEAVLLLHPHIIDAAVIGISYPGSDYEFPRAYVVRRPTVEGQHLDLVEVQQYVADRLAKYKALTVASHSLMPFPRMPVEKSTGKF